MAVFVVPELSLRQEVTPLTPRQTSAVSDANEEEATPRGERQMAGAREKRAMAETKALTQGATSVPALSCISSATRCLFYTPTEGLRENRRRNRNSGRYARRSLQASVSVLTFYRPFDASASARTLEAFSAIAFFVTRHRVSAFFSFN